MDNYNRATYEQLKRDFEALQKIAELQNWNEIGVNILDLMMAPTKVNARHFYKEAIDLWFSENGFAPEAQNILRKNRYGQSE